MRLSRRRARAFMRQLPGRPRLLAGLGVLGLGLTVAAVGVVHRPAAPAAAQPVVVTHSTDRPAEVRPNPATYHWTGRPDAPKYLRLPSIHAEGFIQQVGVDQHQAIAVPTNIHVAGWFVQSRPPGSSGLSIIDGHLDGHTGGGVFEHLARLRVGDQFTVTFGNNSTKTFVVRRVQSAPLNDAAALLFSQDAKINQQLNLITCGGTYNKSRQQYDRRVVVTAQFLPSR